MNFLFLGLTGLTGAGDHPIFSSSLDGGVSALGGGVLPAHRGGTLATGTA